jgi:hypothetical protein
MTKFMSVKINLRFEYFGWSVLVCACAHACVWITISDVNICHVTHRYTRSNAEGSLGRNNQQQSRHRKRRQAANNQLCPTRTEFIMPKAAMNNRGNWMFVVNLNEIDDRYTQLVGTETCAWVHTVSTEMCMGTHSLSTSKHVHKYIQNASWGMLCHCNHSYSSPQTQISIVCVFLLSLPQYSIHSYNFKIQ